MKTIMRITGVIVLGIAVFLTWKWIGLVWWKSVILFMTYGWSLNIDELIRKMK